LSPGTVTLPRSGRPGIERSGVLEGGKDRLQSVRRREGPSFDTATPFWQGARHFAIAANAMADYPSIPVGSLRCRYEPESRGMNMVKPEWGTKRTCPKCGTRFYDLGKEDPVSCIECDEEWHPEPVLKSKQPIPFEEEEKKKDAEPDSDLADDDELGDLDEEEGSPENDVDLGGDDDLGVSKGKGDEEDDES
jgi:uncharacterized protein (TIGR02300 family)